MPVRHDLWPLVNAHFEKMVQQLQSERDARVVELQGPHTGCCGESRGPLGCWGVNRSKLSQT